MRIAVIGTGYVGLVAGVCLADGGHDVVCVDSDADKVRRLKAGEAVIYEPGLEEVQRRVLREGRLGFTTRHAEALAGRQVVVIAVGTPAGADGAPDLAAVEAAASEVARVLTGPIVLVLKSTVPVGTAARVRALVTAVAAFPVHVVSNPEFLREGQALADFRQPDRVVIGTDSDEAWEVMHALYRTYVRDSGQILRMSNASAELAKYASNAMLAARISFVNEMARLCDALGGDIRDVAAAMGSDPRIGRQYLEAGCGYGGSCFPKDTQGLRHIGRAAGVSTRMVDAAEAVNAEQKELLAEKVRRRLGQDLKGRRIALWGLAFKPGTDDVREAPALVVAERLLAAGAEVVGTDPVAIPTFRARFGERLRYEADPYEAARGAHALLLLTEWNEFRAADFDRLRGVMAQPLIFDGRNALDAERLARLGFEVEGIGRPAPARR